MDHLEEAIESLLNTEMDPESDNSDAMLAVAHTLVAICERLDKLIELHELEAERRETGMRILDLREVLEQCSSTEGS